MRDARPCKQCAFFDHCLNIVYPYYDDIFNVTINNIDERRDLHCKMVDCFKSVKQYQLDIASARKSQIKQGIYKGDF